MSGRRVEVEGVPGQDSFLDVVANLVGIMIILVMVVGTRTRDAIISGEEAVDPPAAAAADLSEDGAAKQEQRQAVEALIGAADEARAVEREIHELDAKLKRGQFEIERRRRERNQLHVVLTAVERQLAEHTGQLDAAKQAEFALKRDLLEVNDELAKVAQSREALTKTAEQTSVLEHLPTPMAKTVFGKEIQFRLTGGKLTYIPWDDLLDRLKDEAPQKIWKLKDADSITETLGPVGDFRMKYVLRRAQYAIQSRMGDVMRERIELERFTLSPVREDLGEPVEMALAEGSNFNLMLAGADPKQTTVTIWLYPDSFQHFRTIKHALYKRGFLCASRPLPEGYPIGGSPDGSRSAAQ
jgi:hypothetical protein